MTIEQLPDIARSFVGWQCRLRQHAVRRGDGRPGPGMLAAVSLPDGGVIGTFVTVLVKSDPGEAIAQFRHIVATTHDPRERYEAAIKALQTVYYQYPREFSDRPTALFGPDSASAAAMSAAGELNVVFAQANQRYSLPCTVVATAPGDPCYEATYWHNAMFNPRLPGQATVIRFEPDWQRALAETGITD